MALNMIVSNFSDLVSSHLGLVYVLLVEINSFPILIVIFSRLFTSNIPRYFFYFACFEQCLFLNFMLVNIFTESIWIEQQE